MCVSDMGKFKRMDKQASADLGFGTGIFLYGLFYDRVHYPGEDERTAK